MTAAPGLTLRLVAYQPNGALIGLLPMPSTYEVGTVLNDVSSLTVTYSDMATRSEIFSTPIEVAVEYSNDNQDVWAEPTNCRFILLDQSNDPTDESAMSTYTLPGYAWQLDKAIVNMSAVDRIRYSGKRSFNESSPGALLRKLVLEAQARGVLPGLTLNFTDDADSDGAAWRHDQSGLSFDAGTGLLKVLKAMSDADLIDWCMRGRQLCVYNPQGELAAPRSSKRILKTTSNVNIVTFLNQVTTNLSSNAAAGRGPYGSDDLRAAINVLSIAQHGEPVFDPHGYELAVGIDTTQTAAFPGGMPLALYAKGTPDDAIERATGAFAMQLNAPTRWFFACPRMSNSTRPDLLALSAFLKYGSGAMLLAETDPSLKMQAAWNTGYTRSGQRLIDHGALCVEIETYTASDFPTANVIVEGYPGNRDNLLRKVIAQQLANQGFDVRSNVGPYKETQLDRVQKNVDTMYDYMVRCHNAGANNPGGATAAQRNTIKKANALYQTAVDAKNAVVATMASKNVIAGIYPGEYGPSLGAMGLLGYHALAKRVRYARILVADSISTNNVWMGRFGTALNAALVGLQPPQKIPFTFPKGYVSDTETPDPVLLSAVSLRRGRDITESPTQSSLTDLTARVYAYGDSFSQVVVENTDAVKPWGIWETALANGGVDDTDTLEANAQVALNQGSAARVSMTRGVSFEQAQFVPFKHYDTGDYVRAPQSDGEMVPMRIHQTTISMDGGKLTGSLVMADRFLPVDLKRSKAIVAASGGAVGGALTLGGGVRPVAPVVDVRKLNTPTPKS